MGCRDGVRVVCDRLINLGLDAQPATHHPATPCASTPFDKVPAPQRRQGGNSYQPYGSKASKAHQHCPQCVNSNCRIPFSLSPPAHTQLQPESTPHPKQPSLPVAPSYSPQESCSAQARCISVTPLATRCCDPTTTTTQQPLVYCCLPYAPHFMLLLSARRSL